MEIEAFKQAFSSKKNLKIVIYGTGRMTATLLAAQTGFQIVGLCDRDESRIGTYMYGIPIISKETVEKIADIVIINTTDTYWNTIYQRIKNWEVPVYFRNGQIASEFDNYDFSQNFYWDQSYQNLEQLTDEYDVISFDIFDTLIMRKVMFPIDVFRLVGEKLKLDDIDFVEVRKQAAAMLEYPTIEEIYEKMRDLTGTNADEVKCWQQEEIETEKYMLTERKDMVSLCKRIMKCKPVYLVSDMYFSKDILKNFLEQFGLEVDADHIIVSCDVRKGKETGALWDYFKEQILQERLCLHIGDNYQSDYQKAKERGIDAYWIMNAFEMLQNSSLRLITSEIESLYSSMGMGLICAELFNSPFALNETKGRVVFRNEKQAGYCLLGPLMDTFMRWLIFQGREGQYEQLLFFAREGYLLIPLYQHMKELLSIDDCPEAVYLEISRGAAWMIATESVPDIYEVSKFPFEGNLCEFLRDRFGVYVAEKECEKINISDIQGDINELRAVIKPYEQMILKQCAQAEENYRNYIAGLKIQENFAVVDSLYYGTTQHWFGKFLKRRLSGFYMSVCLDQTNKYLKTNRMKGCFPGLKGQEPMIHRYRMFLDAFFTAPNGMFQCISDDGEKKYAKGMSNQEHFDIRNIMLDGIKMFMDEMIAAFQHCCVSQNTADAAWVDNIYGVLMSGGADVTAVMKKSFFYDNKVFNGRETPIWE